MSSVHSFPDEPLANPDEDAGESGLSSSSPNETRSLVSQNLNVDDEEPDNSEEGVNDVFEGLEGRSLVFDLHSHLTDNDIADVSLCGTDGKSVVAVRSILAMRSRFFKTLFFGQFCERGMDQVPLGYSSLVLKAVVEYCYTDEIKTAFENLSFEETARSMVGLVAAGNYFELKGLMSRAYRLTCLMMDEYPALSCTVLDEVSVSGGGHHASELSRVALGIIRLCPESALLPPDTYGLGVRSLGAAAMERVMADNEIQTEELTLFHCLKKWADYVPPSQGRDDASLEERRATAREIASHIDFAKIKASALSTVVAFSGLVPEELLLNAYRKQALQAEWKGIAFSQVRCTVDNKIGGRIRVQGAGLTAVNGTYAYDGSRLAPVQYTRLGSLPGIGPGTFLLNKHVLQDGIKKWLLSFFQIGVEQQFALYSAPVLSEMDPPPMQKWSPVSVGHERLRTVQMTKNEVKKHTSFDSSQLDDDRGLGYPPPICIWLPDDSKSNG